MFQKLLDKWRNQQGFRGMVYLLLAFLALAFCAVFVLRLGVFGSRIDWVNQHSVFPEYFRKRFYETHDLLPDFAWNLGAGQNIYTISYYGLFSPVILLSYLLPMIPMDYYIMISSIFSYVASVLLMYYWLKSHRYQTPFAAVMTVYFALSAALIYHFYNQIMFVNYMPFLCTAFIGTDRYLKKGKRRLLLYGILGMILTSFYFSIGGMVALCLYALAEYLNQSDVGWKEVFLMGVRYVGQIFIAILISGILLVPTAAIILGDHRMDNPARETAMKLIEFNPVKLLYSPYGAGMTLLVIAAVSGGIICTRKWTERIMPAGLLLLFSFPVVGVLLNGGLYEKTKVFIPFVPLLILQSARFIQTSIRQKATFRLVLPWVVTFLLVLSVWKSPFIAKYHMYILLEMVSCGISFWIAREKKKPEIAVLSSILCLVCVQLWLHPVYNRMMTGKEFSALHDRQVQQQVEEIQAQDSDFYRMESYGDDIQNHNNINRLVNMGQNITSLYSSCYNQGYMEFRKKTFHINEPFRNNMMQSLTNNPVFLQFMGVKYRLNYQNGHDLSVVKNEQAAPVWYVTNQVVSEEEYRCCSFPECQTLLLQRGVVETKEQRDSVGKQETNLSALPKMTRQNLELPERNTGGLTIRSVKEGYQITAREEVACSVPFPGQDPCMDLLAVSFRMNNKNPKQDVFIQINGQTNKLSDYEYGNRNDVFYYMVPYVAGQDLQMVFGRGEYEVTDWKVYTGCLAALQNHELYQQPVKTDLNGPQGDRLSGRVTCEEPGYLITSIPYDDHFELRVDGKRENPVRVNTSFLGARLDAGEHVIQVEYHAPGKTAGLVATLLGIILFELVTVCGRFYQFRHNGLRES